MALNFGIAVKLAFLLFFPLFARAESYDFGGNANYELKTRVGLIAGYTLNQARYTIGGDDSVQASGTGMVAGIEFDSSNLKSTSVWSLGICYSQFQLEMKPNGVREIDNFQDIEVPLNWGILFARRFLLSVGLRARSD